QLGKLRRTQGGDRLKPSSAGKRIQFSNSGKTVVPDAAVVETKELIAGTRFWNVKTLDEAVKWAKRCPNPMPGEEGVLEIRPCYELEDFGEAVTDDFRAHEQRLRKEVARQQMPKAKAKAKVKAKVKTKAKTKIKSKAK